MQGLHDAGDSGSASANSAKKGQGQLGAANQYADRIGSTKEPIKIVHWNNQLEGENSACKAQRQSAAQHDNATGIIGGFKIS